MDPATPVVPARESILSGVEPGAIGSAVVLVGLISAIGFGGWTVLKEVQQVRLAPVENTPTVLTDLDPLDGAVIAQAGDTASGFQPSNFGTSEALDRVYRPEALDVPVIVSRDGPIAAIDPSSVGTLRPEEPAAEPIDPIEAAIASVLSRSADGNAVAKNGQPAPLKAGVEARTADRNSAFPQRAGVSKDAGRQLKRVADAEREDIGKAFIFDHPDRARNAFKRVARFLC